MTTRYSLFLCLLVTALAVGLRAPSTRAEGEKKGAPKTPEIVGAWTGDWVLRSCEGGGP